MPKQHVVEVDELDDVVAKSIMDASKLIAKAIKALYKPDGITICQNGGIFNELTHYHMHVVPRYKERSFAEFYTVQSGEKKNHNLEEIKTLLKEERKYCTLKGVREFLLRLLIFIYLKLLSHVYVNHLSILSVLKLLHLFRVYKIKG